LPPSFTAKQGLRRCGRPGSGAERCQDCGDEPGSRSAIFFVGLGARHFVRRAERQPATGQRAVDLGDVERQYTVRSRNLDPADALAKPVEADSVSREGHAPRTLKHIACQPGAVFALGCIILPNLPSLARSASEIDAAEITARILLETESVLFRPDDPFTFTSGLRSPVYIDCRRLISFPRARKKLMDLAAELIERHSGFESLDAIAGGETAGIPFAAWIADRLSLPMLYVRKQPKGFGRNAQIEGELKEEARVLLVEDLASEGTSKLNFVRAIRQAGGHIDQAFVIFNYGIFPQIETSLAAEGIALLALATWWDVARTAERLGRFAPGQYEAIESFLKDPNGWSKARTSAQR
jgi:orotate phosphoribosyltransferase